MNDAQRERRQRLLSGLIDQELTPEEAAEANDLLVRDTEFRREYEQLRGSAAHIASLKFAEPHDQVLDQLWQSPFSRFSRNAGLLLVGAGCALLVLYAVYHFVQHGEWNVPKIATTTVWVGLAMLFFSVLRERLKTRKSDPYKEVRR